MSTQEKTWNVANRLHSQKDSDNPEVNHIIAGADEIYDDEKGAKQSDINAQTDAALADRYTKSETYSKEQLDSLITTPDVNHVSVVATNATTAVADILPATGEADTIYRVGNWNGTQYDPTMYALFAWNGSAYVCLAVRSFVGEVYDVSVNHPDGQGKPTPYADLAAALGTNGANVPADIRRGGMSIKFIQGTAQSSDNKYVQYRLTKNQWSTTVSDWECLTINVEKLDETSGIFGVSSTFGTVGIESANNLKKCIKKIELHDRTLISKKLILRVFGIQSGDNKFYFYVNDCSSVADDVVPSLTDTEVSHISISALTWSQYKGIKKITGSNGKVSIYVDFDFLKEYPFYIGVGCCYNNSSITNYDIDLIPEIESIETSLEGIGESLSGLGGRMSNAEGNIKDIKPYITPINSVYWGLSFSGNLSEAVLANPIVLSQNGDSVEFELEVLEVGKNQDTAGYSFAKGLANNGIAIGVSTRSLAVRSDDNVWICQFSGTTDIKYKTIKIEYTEGNIKVYQNSTLVTTYEGQNTITINSFGHASTNFGYWKGKILSAKVNGNIYNLVDGNTLNNVSLYRENNLLTDNQSEKLNTACMSPIVIEPIDTTNFNVKVINRKTGKYVVHHFYRYQGSHEINGTTYISLDTWTSDWIRDESGNDIYQGNLNMIYKINKVNGVSVSDSSVNENYHVGPQHGCCVMQFFKFFADGKEFDPSSLSESISCSTFRFITKETCYVVDSTYNTGNNNNYPKVVDGEMVVHGIHYLDAVYEVDNNIKWYNRFVQTRDAAVQYSLMGGGMVQGQCAYNNNVILNDVDNSWNEFEAGTPTPTYSIPSGYSSDILYTIDKLADTVIMYGENNIIHQRLINDDNTMQSHSSIYTMSNNANSVKCYMSPLRTTHLNNPDTFNAGDVIAVHMERKIEFKN